MLIATRVLCLTGVATAGALLALTFLAAGSLGWGPTELLDGGLTTIPWLVIGFTVVGAILAWQRPGNPVGWLLLGVGVTAATQVVSVPGVGIAVAHDWPAWAQATMAAASYSAWSLWLVLICLALLFFPTGNAHGLLAAGTGVAAIAGGAMVIVGAQADPGIGTWLTSIGVPASATLLAPGAVPLLPGRLVTLLPTGLTIVGAAMIGVALVLVIRFIRGDDLIRRQLFWILLAALATGLLYTAINVLGIPAGPFGLLGLLLLPTGILVAILRVGLFDVRFVFSRALAWSILACLLAAAYFALVAVLAAMLVQTTSAVVSALVIALAFEPLRRVLQRAVDRLIYGRRSEPTTLIALVGQGIEHTDDLDGLLASVSNSLRLPWLALRTDADGIVASAGSRPPGAESLPLELGGVAIGALEIAHRRGEGSISRRDREVFALLRPFFALLLRLTRLTTDLARSRERIVQSAEEERRRLQRDLHDGVSSALSGIGFSIEGIRNLVPHDPQTAVMLLAQTHATIVRASDALRAAIDELRPPELDTLGLAEALRLATMLPGAAAVTIEAGDEAGLVSLPAAVEVTLYRIAVESIANARRHSPATQVRVEIGLAPRHVRLRVSDDGGPATAWNPGIGLRSIRERTEMLRGTWRAEPTPVGGVVDVTIPLAGTRV